MSFELAEKRVSRRLSPPSQQSGCRLRIWLSEKGKHETKDCTRCKPCDCPPRLRRIGVHSNCGARRAAHTPSPAHTLRLFPHEDTFGENCFVLSIIAFVVYNLLGSSEGRSPQGHSERERNTHA